jgi:CubicO group peptidase (beta-lactamase class C family)
MTRPVEGAVSASPREVQYDEKRLAFLDAYLSRLVDGGKAQGISFLMARHGKVFAHRAHGRRAPGPDALPLQPDSIKDLASLTKPFTASAVMRLVEDGVLWLGKGVHELIPEMDNPMHRGITLWHLLTHTSGLPPDPGYLGEPYPLPRFDWWDQGGDWLRKAVLAGPTVCRPGESWNYCSLGYTLLAEVVSRAAGKHFYDYVQDEILSPLGMRRTMFAVPQALAGEIAWASEWQRDKPIHMRERAAPDGGGGLASTLPDLFRFAQCFLEGGALDGARVLGRKTVEEMTRNQLQGVPAYHWGKQLRDYRHGLGWGFFCDSSTVGPATFNHEGYGWSALFVDPVERFIYAQFTCDDHPWNPELAVMPRTIAFSGIL